MVQSPGGERHLLALRHRQREHHRLRQRGLRPLHGLRGRRLGAFLRRHLRVGRRQRVLRQVVAPEPGLHLGPIWPRPRPERKLQQDRLPRLRVSRDARQPVRRHRQRRGWHHRRAARWRPGNSDHRPGLDPRLRHRALRSGQVRGRLRPAREPRAVPHRQLVDRRRGHGLAPGVPRRGGRWRRGHPRHRRGRWHPHRGRAQLRSHRPQRVGPDRAHRVQDEPHQGRRRQSRSHHRRDPLLHRREHLAGAALQQVHRSLCPSAVRFGAGGQLQHRVPVRLRTLRAQGRQARALQPGARLRLRSGRAAHHGRHGAADLQRQLPVRRAAAHAHAHRRDRRQARAALVGRRGRARRGPGQRRLRLRGLQDRSTEPDFRVPR